MDEGTIHAWLDDQITDAAEAAWIEEHLRSCADCAARLAEERSMVEQANTLLSVAAPAIEPPAFAELVAKVGTPIPETTSVARMAHERRWLLQAAWAASLALAVGIGWTAREIADREPVQSIVEPTAAERASAGDSNRSDTAAAAPSAIDTATSTPQASPVGSTTPGARPGVVARRAESAATAPPRTPQQAANATPPSSALDAQVESTRRELEGIAGAAAGSARQALAPPAAAPAAVPPPMPERITVTGEVPARPVMTEREWQALPRTEAAARSGMPLYGIDGLEPALTSISPDGRVVRTLYRLESGNVELEQQRAIPGEAPLSAVQATRPALTSRGRAGIIADAASAPPREWSGMRGDVRLTLRSPSVTADLETLGTKLRVD